jgi:hypothetical protein
MVSFANTTTSNMLEHLFLSYVRITVVDLAHNWDNMCRAWDPQQPVETLFKQIQDSVDYTEAGGITISEAHKLHTVYANIFATGNLHSACRHWNKINPVEQTWNNFKIHFATAYRQKNQMQGETAVASGYANVTVVQTADDDLTGAAIGTFAKLVRATAVDRAIVATLTDANSHLTKQLEETS